MSRPWYVTVAVVIALVLACLGAAADATARDFPLLPVIVLSLLALFASSIQSTRLSEANATISLTSILLGAAIPLTGPLGAAVVGFVSAFNPLKRRPLLVRTFNLGMNGLVGAVGGLVYLAVGGEMRVGADSSPLRIIAVQLLPLAVAMIAMLLVNAVCVGVMIAVNDGPPVQTSVRRLVRQVGRTYLGYGVVGFLFAVLWDSVGLGVATVLVMMAPLVLAQWSYLQQHAESVAHERTVSSLVAAVDARDPIMRGRNERVARVSELLGNELRLSPDHADALHFAALLHDVGMVAPVEARRTGDNMRQVDLDRIRRHPARGVEMLRSISFLGHSITAIRHHHERWDGSGYPDGLAGAQIPQLARILAVADAFCALVPRLGVAETVEVLRARSGAQFDPACVDALDAVAEHAGALAAVEPDQAEALVEHSVDSKTSWLDHDLPEVSDLLAGEGATG